MAKVKWIKLNVDIFDDPKFALIDMLENADMIMVVWFKMLVLAGSVNMGGGLFLTENKPYTRKMLATVLKRELSVINEALDIFVEYDMVVEKDGVIMIKNWNKHQDLKKMAEIRDGNRIRQRRKRWRDMGINDFTIKKLEIEVASEPCSYCGVKSDVELTIDHIIPRAKGGTQAYRNIVGACQKCNSNKGSLDLVEFLNSNISEIDVERVMSNEKLNVFVDYENYRFVERKTSKVEIKPKKETVKVVEPKPKTSKVDIYKVEYFENEKVNELFVEFLELRKKLRAVNSERAIKTLVNKLNNHNDDIKLKMIENSIVNSWKGIFELRNSNNGSKEKDYNIGRAKDTIEL